MDSRPPSAPGEPPAKKKGYAKWLAALGLNSLVLSVGVHLLFGVVAAFLVVQHFQKKHVNFRATEPPAPQTEVEHKVQLAKKNNVESAPPDLKRITTTDVSPISLPDVPEVPPVDVVTPTQMAGVGVDGLTGLGTGPGGGGGGGGDVTLFGSSDGVGLAGHFYDLKQTLDKKPAPMDLPNYYQVLRKYLASGWDESVLEQYYRGKKALIADRIAISTRPSGEAPKAFQLQNEVQPGLWVIHYHGKVSVPRGGDFRFIGFADNVLVVRIGGQIVLDAGWDHLTNDTKLYRPLEFAFPSYIKPAQEQEAKDPHLRQGVSFHLDVMAPTDMDILIGDDGGKCSFFLLVQRGGQTYQGTPAEYPFFQFSNADAPTFPFGEECPPYSHEPEPWQASKIDETSP